MELSRCKVCGYIMETGKIEDVCPACGVPAKVFEPYKLTISEDRYKWLSLHMHPIILHFPQAFVVTGMGLLLLSFFFTGELKALTVTVIQFNLIFLPLTVIMGALTGVKDGQLRFKKLSPPVLQLKIKMSVAFFLLSIVTAVMCVTLPFTLVNTGLMFALTLIQTVIAALLGRIGSKLIDAWIPGK